MDLDTVRVELGDGQWWDICVEMPWGVSQRIRAIVAPALSMNGAEDGQMAMDSSKISMEMVAELNNARLLGCTVAWSFGKPVSAKALDAQWMTRSHAQAVLTKMDELYGEGDEADQEERDEAGADLKKDSRSPSSRKKPHLTS